MTFGGESSVAEAWSDGDTLVDTRGAGPSAEPRDGRPVPGSIAVRAADPSRRRYLERILGGVAESAADVLIVDMPMGLGISGETGAFEGALLALSDDARLAADRAIAGVLPKTAAPSQIRAAAAAVAEGLWVRVAPPAEPTGFAPMHNAALDPAHPDGVGSASRPGTRATASRPLLTPRELEILAEVGEGLSNKAIARRLAISAHTVKYHLEAVFAKLGVNSRAEAVSIGLRSGLLVV